MLTNWKNLQLEEQIRCYIPVIEIITKNNFEFSFVKLLKKITDSHWVVLVAAFQIRILNVNTTYCQTMM